MNDNSITLFHRIDEDKEDARFYLIQVGPSLLDEHAVLRVWGEIGGNQQHTVTACASAAEARSLARRVARQRLRQGYRQVSMESPVQEEILH
jgi:predicted DNA-binding WGR domain protein